jgi:hypothetical protein
VSGPRQVEIRSGAAVFGSVVGLCLLPALATGQTLPVPLIPDSERAARTSSRPAGAEPADALVAALETPTKPQPWEYAFGLGAGWDSNIDFVATKGPRGGSLSPRAGLARVFTSRHGQLRATAAARWTEYPDQKDLRGYYGDASLEGYYGSRRTGVWGTATYGLGDSAWSQLLIEQGVAVPRVKMRSLTASGGVFRTVGRRSTLRMEGRFYRTEFDSDLLVDGETVRAGVGLERQLGSATSATLGYSFERMRADRPGGDYLTHYGSLQWTHALSRRSGVLLEAGASYTPNAARAELEHDQSFFGGASFSRAVRRSSLTAFVRREVAPALGIGISRLTLRTGVRASVPVGRAWSMRVDASHVQPDRRAAADREDGSSDDVFFVLSRRLGRRIGLSSETRYRRGGATSRMPEVTGFQAGLFLTVIGPSERAADLLR